MALRATSNQRFNDTLLVVFGRPDSNTSFRWRSASGSYFTSALPLSSSRRCLWAAATAAALEPLPSADVNDAAMALGDGTAVLLLRNELRRASRRVGPFKDGDAGRLPKEEDESRLSDERRLRTAPSL